MTRKNNWWGKTLTNLDHFKEEIQIWRILMRPHLEKFSRADGFADKTHEGMNVIKESFALLPYTLSHLWVYSLIISLLGGIALGVYAYRLYG